MSISDKTWTVKKVLLVCGVLASLIYIGTDILAALSWEGYSYTDQMISELMAVGAPTRSFMIPPMMVYNVLVIAFGTGVLVSAGRKRSLRVAGILLIAYGIISGAGPFVPMHPRGTVVTQTDTMHKIATSVIVLLTLLYIGFGAAARGKGFRIYSIGTIVTLLVFGALAGSQAPRIEAGLPTPWFGIMERVNIYVSMLWVAVFAVALLRDRGGESGNLHQG